MRYAQIRSMDISNGDGVGISLFVQGCHFHCYNCFNSETWDFQGGSEWTKEIKSQFLGLIDKPFVKRVSILGGEPMADENVNEICMLLNEIRYTFRDKIIWLYTGYTWEELFDYHWQEKVDLMFSENLLERRTDLIKTCRQNTIKLCDVLVDGKYIDDERDMTLKWRGSKNQRVIDVQKSLCKRELVQHCLNISD